MRVAAAFTAFFCLFFWPVLGHGTIFGDAVDQLIEALPMYAGGHPFWQPLTMLGFPYSANPLSVTWYPLAALRFVPGSYDVYELSAYVLAACGAFGLARAVTRSTTGAAVAGLVYALSGFMIGHAGHIGLIHPAAWAPWVFWALVALRERADARNVACTAAAFAMLALAGQPQVLVYTLFAAGAYVLVAWSRPFALRFLAALGLGAALAAIVLLPGIQLALVSARAHLTLEAHVGFGVPAGTLPFRLLFPYVLGQTTLAPYTLSGFNIGSFAEMSDYVGVTTLVLALLGATARGGRRVGFFTGMFVVALALSTGNDLGLGTLTYHVPPLNWFRAPGRYAFEVALAASVLAAAGIAAIERADASLRRVAICWTAIGAAMAIVLAVIAGFGPALAHAVARAFGIAALPPETLDLARNAALWVPLLALALGGLALGAFAYRPRAALSRTFLVAAVALDLTSFGWFGYWNYGAFPLARIAPPAEAAGLRAAIEPAGQRVLGVPTENAGDGIAPNLNVLWNLASVRGYTTLGLARSTDFLRVDSLGSLAAVLASGDRTLDAAGVRFAVVPGGLAATRTSANPLDPGSVLNLRAGANEPDVSASFGIDLPATPATRVALGSALVDGAGLANGSVVAELRVFDAAGASESVDVRGGPGPARIDVLTLPAPIVARRIEVRWLGPGTVAAALDVERLALIDDRTGIATPITALTFLTDAPQRWHPVAAFGGTDRIFENVRAFPRAWIVHRTQSLDAGPALAAIVAGRWDPANVALVGAAVPQPEPAVRGIPETVRIERIESGAMVLDATCSARCIVITSDATYPGWSARVDTAAVPIVEADYALRGVVVPAGTHRVVFTFRPWTTYAGAAISLAALAEALWLVRRRRRAS